MTVKINFILPFKPRRPAGGFRIMYEYANRLALKGYDIHLYYPVKTPYIQYRLPCPVRSFLTKLERFNTYKWFEFNKSIKMSHIPEVKDKYIGDADIIIATWWSTAMQMGELSESKGKKINLIQGYEDWEGHKELLFQSYNMPEVINIVVSSHLKAIVEEHTAKPAILIRNSIDSLKYQILTDPSKRQPATVAMTYSIQKIKGSDYGLKALQSVKETIPELKVEMFGVCPAPTNLPNWIKFYRNPDNLNEIYNRNAIFISNSLTEGFPLTPAESMFCGCALICTDIEGHKEYAKDGETALLTEAEKPEQMADSIINLIRNNEKRIQIAKAGNKYIQRYKWDNAVERIENTINDLLSEKRKEG